MRLINFLVGILELFHDLCGGNTPQCVVYWKTFTNFAVPSPRMATYCLVKVFR